MKIVAFNPSVESLEKSWLKESYAREQTDLKIQNNNNFKEDSIVMIGAPARERTELGYLSAKTGSTQITLADPTEFPHDADDPVYVLQFDKVRIYRSTSGVNGNYDELVTIDIDVDNADGRTYYIDPTAMVSYFYKISYFNSVTEEESEATDPIAATGYDPTAAGSIIGAVAHEVGDPDFLNMSIDVYIHHMNDISEDLIMQAKRPYRFLKRETKVDLDINDSSFPFPDDLWKLDSVEVNEAGPASSRIFQPKWVSPTQARSDLSLQTLGGDYVDKIAIDDYANEVLFVPKARTARVGAFTLFYYKKFDQINALTDKVETPNGLVYKYGLKRDYYMKRTIDDDKYFKMGLEYEKRYNAEIMKLQREKNIVAGAPLSMAPDRKRYPQWGGRRYRQ